MTDGVVFFNNLLMPSPQDRAAKIKPNRASFTRVIPPRQSQHQGQTFRRPCDLHELLAIKSDDEGDYSSPFCRKSR
jgi:hypothetical protein